MQGEKGVSGAAAAGSEGDRKLRKACADFESLLVFQMFKTMRRTVPPSGFLPASQGKATYESMLDQRIADDLSRKGGGLGLQKILYEQMTRRAQKKD